MDLLGGIFILLVAILVVVSILLGFVIYNSINRRTQAGGRQGITATNEVQSDSIEGKLDRYIESKLGRSSKFSWYAFPYTLGVTVMGVGLGLIGINITQGIVISFVGLGLSIFGLVHLFRHGWFSKR